MSVSTLAANGPAAPARSLYYPALTGLRAVAAYLVFFHHFRPLALSEGWPLLLSKQLYVGVSLFFVLSGFVLTTRYQQRVQLSVRWWWAYFWQRAARIYPTYLLLNTAILARIYWPIPTGKLGNTLLLVFLSESLLRGFSNTLKYVGLPQGWSLTPEECFYVSLPFLLLLWQRRGILGAVGFALAMLSIGLLLTAVCQGRPALHGFFGTYHHLFNFTFFGRVFEFVLGVGLARWWGGRPSGEASGWPWRTLAGSLIILGTIAGLASFNSPRPWYEGTVYPPAIMLNIIVFPGGRSAAAGRAAGRAQLAASVAGHTTFAGVGAQLVFLLSAAHRRAQPVVAGPVWLEPPCGTTIFSHGAAGRARVPLFRAAGAPLAAGPHPGRRYFLLIFLCIQCLRPRSHAPLPPLTTQP
ncbi:acyltransferase family protein [Hymenobacter ginsengisoli]|uniref:acyltransferase family protein n=1 Tax=Hymenobacter sp. KCTC 23674 TaxID=2864219 RepID=UPI001C6A2D12|nr:acyltransferase [Hymenobacter sp. KCTC 23674]